MKQVTNELIFDISQNLKKYPSIYCLSLICHDLPHLLIKISPTLSNGEWGECNTVRSITFHASVCFIILNYHTNHEENSSNGREGPTSCQILHSSESLYLLESKIP